MRAYLPQRNTLIGVSTVVLALASGCVPAGNWNLVWHERTVEQQVPRGEASALDVQTTAGSIDVTGTETEDVSVVATIRAGAATEEEARQLAEQVAIRLKPVGQTLRIVAATPALTRGRSVQVSYAIGSPREMAVRCDSGYGAMNIAGIEGTVAGKTGNGSIHVQDVQGPVDVHSSYGSITCRNVTGQMVRLRSGNGSIAASDIRGSAELQSSYGAVTCERLSEGNLRLHSGNGRVVVVESTFGVCDARSSYGKVGGNALKGESIKMESGNGGVELTDGQADRIVLSSSYGKVEARQLVTSELAAHSGHGGLNIVCSPATSSDLKAEVTSSYGGIDFAASPDFAGEVLLRTDYGSVHTDLPIAMTGEITGKEITGRIGDGGGTLRLETSNGSIHLK